MKNNVHPLRLFFGFNSLLFVPSEVLPLTSTLLSTSNYQKRSVTSKDLASLEIDSSKGYGTRKGWGRKAGKEKKGKNPRCC
jgi:hypothetical protein